MVQKDIIAMIEHIAARWETADKAILRRIPALICEGGPVPVSRIAAESEVDVATVERSLTQNRVGTDHEGRAVELFGLGLVPTLHRLEFNRVVLFSCCALVAQMAPALTGQAAKVESVDPVRRSLVRLEVTTDGIDSVMPMSAVATLVVTTRDGVMNDVGSNFCTHIHHFADRESAAEFVTKDSRRFTVELDELFDAGQRLYQRIWI